MLSHPTSRSCLVPAAIILAAGAAGPVLAQTVTLYTFNGDNENDWLGWSVSGAGDVNGDGFDDLIVGAPLDQNNGFNSGSARVFSGADGSVLYTFNGDNAGDIFGRSVSGAGDVNGDGFDDLIVGAFGNASGFASIFSGANGSVLFTFNGDNHGDAFGWSVSGAGDVNGDGFDDLIVGAVSDDNNGDRSGSARVFSGADGSVLYTFNGNGNDQFGVSVSGAGDVNGDGFDDLIVGARKMANYYSSTVRVFSGADGSVLLTLNGESSESDRFGYSVSGAGDVNGDGFDDLIVGAPYNNHNGYISSGSAYVFSGADGSTLFTHNGDNSGDQFGRSVSGAGDVNGDGFDDLIVGAWRDDNNGFESGSARAFSGADGSVLFTLNGDSLVGFFGYSVSGAGDVNGDGLDDVVVGAYSDDNNGDESGSAQVFIVLARLCADQNQDWQATPADFSAWIANLNAQSLRADVNQDGFVTPADFSAWIAAFNQGENGPTCVP